MTLEDWNDMKEHISYDFLQDGHFAELKKSELMTDKLEQLGTVESYIGTFFSKEWVQKNILRLTDTEIEDMQSQINKEAGLDPDEGGVDVPDNTDGVTRYPQDASGSAIAPDDVDAYDGEKQGVDDMESDKDFMLKNSKRKKK